MSSPFVALMRRYCIDYTARHDLTVPDSLMEPDYTLHMGGHDVRGRDDAYKPAAAAQFRQFPGLGLTVNGIVCSGDRLALRFSEHGASVRHEGAAASWSGIGLYRWNGTRLTENFVEQDYFARRRQLADAYTDEVETPAVAPWDTDVRPPDPDLEDRTRRWLADHELTTTPGVVVDDARAGHPVAPLLTGTRLELDDIFSAGDVVALHGVQYGTVGADETEFTPFEGRDAHVHLAAVLTVTAAGEVTGGRLIRDRLGLYKRLTRD